MSEKNNPEITEVLNPVVESAVAKKRSPKRAVRRKALKAIARPGLRAGSKGAKVLELVSRTKGATIAELMKTTKWQAHSIRGFLSTLSKKLTVSVESSKTESGHRTYRIGK